MQIQVHTDKNVARHEATSAHIEQVVGKDLQRFIDQITRVEVHLNDTNGPKSGANDQRCMMEARINNHPPVAVTHHAGNLHQAIDGASEKLKRAVDSALAKQQAPKRNGGPAVADEEEQAEDA